MLVTLGTGISSFWAFMGIIGVVSFSWWMILPVALGAALEARLDYVRTHR